MSPISTFADLFKSSPPAPVMSTLPASREGSGTFSGFLNDLLNTADKAADVVNKFESDDPKESAVKPTEDPGGGIRSTMTAGLSSLPSWVLPAIGITALAGLTIVIARK
jgi:hypothetical protein